MRCRTVKLLLSCIWFLSICVLGESICAAQVPDGTVTVGAKPNSIAIDSTINTIYVANSGSSTVTVIDEATKVTRAVNVGKSTYYPGVGPSYNIAVNLVTHKVYVANVDDGTVTAIDPNNDYAAATIDFGGPTVSQPVGIAINTQTNKIYVADYKAQKVWVIDGRDNSFISVPSGYEGRSIVVNEARNEVYVSSQVDHILSVVDGTSNTSATHELDEKPWNMVLDPVRTCLYITNPRFQSQRVRQQYDRAVDQRNHQRSRPRLQQLER